MHLDYCPHTIFDNNPGVLSCAQIDDPIFNLHSAISNLDKEDGRGFEFFDLKLSEDEKESLSALTMNYRNLQFNEGASVSFESIDNLKHDIYRAYSDARIQNYINCENNCTDIRNIIIDRAKIALRAMVCDDTKIYISPSIMSSTDRITFHFEGYGLAHVPRQGHFVVFNLIGDDTLYNLYDGTTYLPNLPYERCVKRNDPYDHVAIKKCFDEYESFLFRGSQHQAAIVSRTRGIHTGPPLTGPRLFVQLAPYGCMQV